MGPTLRCTDRAMSGGYPWSSRPAVVGPAGAVGPYGTDPDADAGTDDTTGDTAVDPLGDVAGRG